MSIFEGKGPKTAHGKINKMVTGDGRKPFEKQLGKELDKSTSRLRNEIDTLSSGILGVKKKR